VKLHGAAFQKTVILKLKDSLCVYGLISSVTYFHSSEKMYSDMNHASHQQAVAIVILVMVLTISPVIIFFVRNATQTIQVRKLCFQ
jgi:hypothetical protein